MCFNSPRPISLTHILCRFSIVLSLAAGLSIRRAAADQVTLVASKDNTIYSEADDVSNGAGSYFFAGRTNSGLLRRGLFAFDTSAIPSGSTVTSVTVTLYMSRTQTGTFTVSLRRLTADWGEGTSDAGGQEGGGQPASDGDATWVYRFYNLSDPPSSPAWSTAGGDFSGTASASTSVGGVGFYTWSSTPGLVADVQAWVNNPSANFGWILIGNEGGSQSTKRFNTRTDSTPSRRPSVTIVYTPPVLNGACCFDAGNCQVLTLADCTSQDGNYLGDGTDCTPNPCPKPGACCLPGGGCIDVLEADCLAQSGTFQGEGTTCATTDCNGACCLAGGTCQVSTLDDCTTNDGAYQGFATTCTPNPCEEPEGACCFDDGSCQVLSAMSCDAQSGDYSGDGTTCMPNLCPQAGACCFNEGTCQELLESDCTSNGGEFGGEGTTCTPNPCPQPGACCFDDGSCLVEFASDCQTNGGAYQGDGTTCTPNPCPQPGACCFSNGSCADLLEADCTAQSGAFQGEGVVCTNGLCPVILEPFVDALAIPPIATPTVGTIGMAATYDMAMVQVEQQLHRDLPPTTVWAYNGVYPGPTIVARQDEPVTVNWINDLKNSNGTPRTDHYLDVDLCPHGAANLPKVVVHLHGGHVPADVDGYPEDTFLPGAMETYVYPNNQQASLIWYHDHALGITRLNVYMGLAGAYIIRDAVEDALGLPSGEFEVPLIIQDRTFNPDGSLNYPSAWQDHFFGDTMLVNGTVWPYMSVKQGKYRFRTLNGCNSRTLTLSLSNGQTFQSIGADGGLLEAPVTLSELTLGPAERADVIIDFSTNAPGTEIVLNNSAPAPFPGLPGAGVIPQVMKFVVVGTTGFTDPIPTSLAALETLDPADAVVDREFELRKGDDPCTGTQWQINGLPWHHITEFPRLGTTETWAFINDSGVSHPMHIHLVFFQVLYSQDFEIVGEDINTTGPRVPPPPEQAGWKDTVMVPPHQLVKVIARFEDYAGLYPYHCHILEHEDHEMMRQFRAVVHGDFDVDGDVDLIDYATFSACINGPNNAPNPTPPPTVQQCLEAFDADFDGDVDLDDFASFGLEFSGM